MPQRPYLSDTDKELSQLSRHYDNLGWIVTTLWAASIGGLLIFCYSSAARHSWLIVMGLVLSLLAVAFAGSFRRLRYRVHEAMSDSIVPLYTSRGLVRQWDLLVFAGGLLVVSWCQLVSLAIDTWFAVVLAILAGGLLTATFVWGDPRPEVEHIEPHWLISEIERRLPRGSTSRGFVLVFVTVAPLLALLLFHAAFGGTAASASRSGGVRADNPEHAAAYSYAWSNWVTAVGTCLGALGTFIVAYIALFQDRFWRPKFDTAVDVAMQSDTDYPADRQAHGKSLSVIRVKVRNRPGCRAARNCRAYLIGIEGSAGYGNDVRELGWRNDLSMGPSGRNLLPGVDHWIDLAYAILGVPDLRFFVCPKWVERWEKDWTDEKSYVLRVQVSAENADTLVVKIRVTWNGDWTSLHGEQVGEAQVVR